MNSHSTAVVHPFPMAVSLAWTFLFMGLGYAMPFALEAIKLPLDQQWSPEVANLYSLVGGLGMVHFLYAYQGQWKSMRRTEDRGMWRIWVLGMVAGMIMLIFLQILLGGMLFQMAIWIYFIPHFIKAETHFQQVTQGGNQLFTIQVWGFPTLAFALFSIVLFVPIEFLSAWRLIGFVAAVVLVGWFSGAIRQLNLPWVSGWSLVGFFLLGECLVWGTYRVYMSEAFQLGLYTFHIAAASFFHYFRAYAFMMRRGTNTSWRTMGNLLLLHGIWLLLMFELSRRDLGGVWEYIFYSKYFIFWVGVHLLSSDLFSLYKHRTGVWNSAFISRFQRKPHLT